MKKKILFISLTLLCSFVLKAQNFMINDLDITQGYTLAEAKEALGEPVKVNSWDSDAGGGTSYRLSYNGGDILCFDNENTYLFVFKTNKFKVCNVFRVGDNISILSELSNVSLILKKTGLYYLYVREFEDPIEIEFVNDVITRISFSMSL